MPVIVGGTIIFINNSKLMKDYKPGWILNTLLVLAFIFSMIISYTGILALITSLKG